MIVVSQTTNFKHPIFIKKLMKNSTKFDKFLQKVTPIQNLVKNLTILVYLNIILYKYFYIHGNRVYDIQTK